MSNLWIDFACLGSGCMFLWCRSRALMPYSLSFALLAFSPFLGEHMSISYFVLKNLWLIRINLQHSSGSKFHEVVYGHVTFC
jgi:hypothetical protein